MSPTQLATCFRRLTRAVRWYQGVYDESWTNLEEGKDPSTKGPGRFVRVNFPNFQKLSEKEWIRGPTVCAVSGARNRILSLPPLGLQIAGEGIYVCFNQGSCIGPDTCDCADGWEGYDCNTRT